MQKEVKEFLDYLLMDKNPRTAYVYVRDLERLLRFCRKPPKELTVRDISNFYTFLRERYEYSDRSLNRVGWALKKYLEFVGEYRLAGMVPRPFYTAKEPKWIEDESVVMKLVLSPNPRDAAVLGTAYDLALRAGEVPLLVREKYNPSTGGIEVVRLKHKQHPDRYILNVDDWCKKLLNNYIEIADPTSHLFPYSEATVLKIFRANAERAGLPTTGDNGYTFHCLRHSRITHIAIRELKEKGFVDELSLSKFAGHLRVETTRLYLHLAAKYLAFGGKHY